MLGLLEVDRDFAKKVAVPAVSNTRELAAVLQESKVLSSSEVNSAMKTVMQRIGGDSVGVGVKTVLDCVFEAKAGGAETDVAETLSDLLEEQVREAQGAGGQGQRER